MSTVRSNLVRFGSTAVLLGAIPLAAALDAPQQVPPETPPAPGQAQEATDEAGEQRRVEALRAVSAERRDEAIATARRAADDLDRQMERLQRQMDDGWDRMSQATRSRSQATMTGLRQRRNALAEWFGGMRHSSGAAWSEVRGGFMKSYQELAEALRKARAEFAGDQADRAPDADDSSADADDRAPTP